MRGSRTCILVSPYFPPSTLAGVHRARHLAKYLPTVGWQAIVVCVDERYHEERLDPGLAALVPASVEVLKVAALSSAITRPFGFGEISLRAWPYLRRALLGAISARQIDAVLITGSPYYPMLFAREIRRRGVPVVLDFQDPWVSNWGDAQPRLSKRGFSHALANLLEPRAVGAANFITSVSDIQNAEMATRYPWLDRSKMAAIPIGGDPRDYDVLQRFGADVGLLPFGEGRFEISYVGTIWPPVIETLRAFLRAVKRLANQAPEVYERVRVNFVGSSADPSDTGGSRVMPLAVAEGVGDRVREVPRRLPYLEALSIQARSDAILILGSDESHYTASKVFGVLMSGRPYLSIFHRLSSSHEILTKTGGGIALSFNGKDDLVALEQPIVDALVRLVSAPESLGRADPSAYAPYEACAVAARYAAIFERISTTSGVAF